MAVTLGSLLRISGSTQRSPGDPPHIEQEHPDNGLLGIHANSKDSEQTVVEPLVHDGLTACPAGSACGTRLVPHSPNG